MATKLSLNSIDQSIFRVSAAQDQDRSQDRADIIAEGRVLFYEHARKGQSAIYRARNLSADTAPEQINGKQYSELNRTFQAEHLLYAAKKACEITGQNAPETFEEFKRRGAQFYGNDLFYKVLQGIYQDIITPILPRVYSEAVDTFADTVEVGFGETAAISVESGDIPVFQDSAWGSSWSVPKNRFYAKDITLNPQPKTCEIVAKWHQLVGNDVDFGAFFANIVAGMYAKTMAMWSAALVAASADTTMIPSGLTYNFNNVNWVTLANKLAALNNTSISNLFATGSAVALAKVLPNTVTGSTNVNMDAAIATLLGADYTRSGYLGEFMAVRLMPLTDAIVPGTQYGSVNTILDSTKIWMMTSRGRRPMTVAYNRDTPISLEVEPMRNAAFEVGINLTIALDIAAVFAQRIGLVNIS